MSGAVLVTIAAAIGNLLQGWDNATIAGSLLYIKKEFKLESEPTVEGLIVAMSLIGATLVTTCSGAVADFLGRRPMLIISSVFYFLSSLVMLWSPNVYILLFARLLDGLGIGLAVTLVPLYISETAPPEIRGLLNTLPQFTGSTGMFLSYCMVFAMSLTKAPSWRLMLGVLWIPSLIYFVLTLFFLPESPRWLVTKGRMLEAKKVLQRLRGRDDVTGEMALLVEGLGVGGDTTIEEYIIGPANEFNDVEDPSAKTEHIKLYGPDRAPSMVAKPTSGQSSLGLVSRKGSIVNQSALVDPVVRLFGSIHENLPETGSTFFPQFGSMFGVGGNQPRNEDWDVEEDVLAREGDDVSNAVAGDSDDHLQTPLISRETTSMDKDIPAPAQGSQLSMRQGSNLLGSAGEPAGGSTAIGGGWNLAWKYTEKEGPDGSKQAGFQRVYFHQEGTLGSKRGSQLSLVGGGDVMTDGEVVHAAALVSQRSLYKKDIMNQQEVGPAMVPPSETGAKGPSWSDLCEPGVKQALIVGVVLQILQQFSGINGVLYYTPQILEQAGVGYLLANLGLSSTSASLLISTVLTLLMLPCIAVAMRLMDISGRRALLLSTIPVLIASLLILVLASFVDLGSAVNAGISTASVVVYFCSFVMGFGPIPNILCAEIFPTRVRGLCIAICALTFWICDIIVTYSLPLMLNSVGLVGVFGIYSLVCTIAWVFVFLKVPETKGMPLEVIIEFFSVGAKQAQAATNT
ncbi:trans-aconitate methyltransferase 2 [Stylosanthes scabra]|uniref:Trans-aconitate methyltransferase 2 n=1 Tax=Stylosanthes scabra TaxID=79078 RepID=A0ABU6Q3C7_9FABA|nr:trans-aconitate methyltransferase 2 [Stylosanthes scabra]